MPYATPYTPTYRFYYGSESQPSTVPGQIYEAYDNLQFTEGRGDEAYNIDPTTIEQRAARQDLAGLAFTLAQQYSDIPPLPTNLPPEDAQYVRDLAVFLNRSGYGIPVEGGRYGDNAGDGPGIGSLFANEFFLAALGTGIAGGAALLGAAPAAAGAAGAASAGTAAAAEGGGLALGLGEGLGALGPSLGAISAEGAGIAGAGTLAGGVAPAVAGATAAGTGAALTSGGGSTAGAGSAATPAAAGTTATGSGGFLGTGLSAGQAIKLAAALGTTVPQLAAAIGGGSNSGDSDSVAGDAEALFQRLRELAVRSTAPQQAQALEGIREATELTNASPQAILAPLRDQIASVRQQLQQRFGAASKSLGFSGGRQVQRAQAESLTGAGKQLQDLLAESVAPGATTLRQYLGQVRPALIASLPQPSTTRQDLPYDFAGLQAGLTGLGRIYQNADRLFGSTDSQPAGFEALYT